MKKFIIIALLFFHFSFVNAQETVSALSDDSSRTIQLKEVMLLSLQKTQLQQLISYYRANSTATLEEIMSRLPEVSLLRRGSYGMEPSIRSFNGGQINVLLDGMHIHGACTDKMDPVTIYIEPLNLDQLQVQTASAGFFSGSSIGGTMNMKMAEPDYLVSKNISGALSSGYQSSARSFYESLRINYTKNRWALLATGTYRHSGNYHAGNGKEIPFSGYEKVNYSLSAKYRFDNYTFIKADVLFDDGWHIGYPALPMDVGYAAARIVSFAVQNENHDKRIYKWKVKLYANKIRHFMDDSQRPDVAMHMDMPGRSETAGLYAESETKLNSRQSLLLRSDASTTFLKASMTMYQQGQRPMYMLTWPDNRKNQFGFSASWLWQASKLYKIQLTTRADYITSRLTTAEAKDQLSVFGSTTAKLSDWLKNISLQAQRKSGPHWKLSTSIAYTERIATASERYGFYLFNSSDNYDYIGNTLLKPEQALQADFSVAYQWKQNKIQLTAFASHIRHFITGETDSSLSTMTNGANGVKVFVNLPYAQLAGFEASALLKPSTATVVVSTLRYTYGRDKWREPLPMIAPLKNITSLRWQYKQFFFQPETEAATAQCRINKKAGEDATDGYLLLHFRSGYKGILFNKMIEVQSGIENLLDQSYHEHSDWGNVPRPGRNIYVQLKLVF